MQDIHYDSQAPLAAPLKNFQLTVPNQEQIVTIQFKFKIATAKPNMVLLNTASGNSGIKLKIEKDILVLSVPALDKSEPFATQLYEKIAPNEWHTLNVTAWNGHYVRAIIDNMPPLMMYQLELARPTIDFKIGTIQVGTGTPPEPNFSGEIKDLKLNVKLVDRHHRHKINFMLHWLTNFFGLIAIWMFILLGMQAMPRQAKIEYLAFFILIGFFVAVVYHYILGTYWGLGYPKNTFIVFAAQFADFYVSLFQDFNLDPYRYSMIPGEYFPFAYVVIYPLVLLNMHAALVLYCLVYLLFMWGFVKHYFSQPVNSLGDRLANFKNIFIIGLMTYPVIFTYERANLEILLFIFTALAIYFYQTQRFALTVVLIAIAGAMKLYPLFIVALFVSDRRYLLTCVTLALTAIFTELALLVIKPGSYETVLAFLMVLIKLGSNSTLLPESCINFNSGLWGALKIMQQVGTIKLPVLSLYHVYFKIAMLGVGITALYVMFIETVLWRKLMLIFSAILLFPFVSYDYKLLYLYIPLAAFVMEKPSRFDLGYLTLFVLLMVPKNYFWLLNTVGISSVLTPIILLLFWIVLISVGTTQKFLHKELK